MKDRHHRFAGRYVPLLLTIPMVLMMTGCSTRAGNDQTAAGGYVIVQFCIERTGTVSHARVMESSPPGKFNASALQIIRQSHYRPAMFVGVPTRYCGVREKITFSPSGKATREANLGTDLETNPNFHQDW